MSANWVNYEVIYEQCNPGKGKKKRGLRILTSELSGEKVGDIEYHNLSYEKSGNYRITKIINLVTERKRAKKEQENKQAQEKERLAKFKVEFDDDLEFAIEACAKGLSIEEAKTEYWRRWDERVQKVAIAESIVTEDSSSEDPRDFITVGKELAQAEGITLGQALKLVARKQPELHRAYKDKCCGQSRADYGQGF